MSKVGVVLPVYNKKPEYLQECLLALEQQSFRDFKLAIVLDGADQLTVDTVIGLQGLLTCPYTIIDRKENKGIAYSLNEGFEYLKDCPYLTWVSSDNRQGKDFLKTLSEKMDHAPADTVLIYSMYWPMNERGECHIPEHIWYPDMYKYMNRKKEEILQTCFVGVSFLFKRSAYESCGGYDPAYGKVADYEFWVRLMRCGEFVLIADALME